MPKVKRVGCALNIRVALTLALSVYTVEATPTVNQQIAANLGGGLDLYVHDYMNFPNIHGGKNNTLYSIQEQTIDIYNIYDIYDIKPMSGNITTTAMTPNDLPRFSPPPENFVTNYPPSGPGFLSWMFLIITLAGILTRPGGEKRPGSYTSNGQDLMNRKRQKKHRGSTSKKAEHRHLKQHGNNNRRQHEREYDNSKKRKLNKKQNSVRKRIYQLATMNVRGLFGMMMGAGSRNKKNRAFEEFCDMMEEMHTRSDPLLAIAIQETWTGIGEFPRDVPGYRWMHQGRDERKKRKDRTAGGVGFLIHDSIPLGDVSLVDMTLHKHSQSTLWIRIEDGLQGIYLGSIYVDDKRALGHMDIDSDELWNAHLQFIQHIKSISNSTNIFLMGDFNAHVGEQQEVPSMPRKLPKHRPTHNTGYGNNMIRLLRENEMLIANGRNSDVQYSAPTRYPEGYGNPANRKKPTQIDFVVTTMHAMQSRVEKVSVMPHLKDVSDHCMVKAAIRMEADSTLFQNKQGATNTHFHNAPAKEVTRINYKKLGNNKVAEKLAEELNEVIAKWDKEHTTLQEVQKPYDNLTNKITGVLLRNLGDQVSTANRDLQNTHNKKRRNMMDELKQRNGILQNKKKRYRKKHAQRDMRKSNNHKERLGRAHVRSALGGNPSTKPTSRVDDIKLRERVKHNRDRLTSIVDESKSAKIAVLLGMLDKAILAKDSEATAVLLRRVSEAWTIRPAQSMTLIENGVALLTDLHIAEGHQNFWKKVAGEEDPTNSVAASNKEWLKNKKAEPFMPHLPPQVGPNFIHKKSTLANYQHYMGSAVEPEEIEVVVDGSNSKSAPGKDMIKYTILGMLDKPGRVALARLFTKCIQDGKTPDQWKEASVKMLYKLNPHTQKEQTADPSNYRGISLLSCIGKIFESILNRRITRYLEAFNKLDDIQNGFRKKRSGEMHLFTLDECLLQGGNNLPVCFIDIKKAFPSVRRDSLLRALYDIGITGPVWRVIVGMYENNQSVIVVGTSESSGYQVQNGVREGAILSPILFTIFLNPLLQQLRRLNKGMFFRNTWCGALAYADDLVLIGANLSKDPEGTQLQAMMDICDKFAHEHMLQFGHSKTAVVLFSPRYLGDNDVPTWTMTETDKGPKGASTVEVVEKKKYYIYLGLRFNDDLKWDKHVDHEPTKLEPEMGVLQKLRTALAKIRSTLANHAVLCPKTAMAVIRTMAMPVALYGSAIWAPSDFDDNKKSICRTTARTMGKLRKSFRSTLLAVLGVGYHANMKAVNRELGWGEMKFELSRAKLSLLKSILDQGKERIQRKIIHFRLQQIKVIKGGHTLHAHASIKGKDKQIRTSYFLVSCINILAKTPHSFDMVRTINTSAKWKTKQFNLTKKVYLPGVYRDFFIASFNKGAARNYFKANGWHMLPDIASIKNMDEDGDRLLIAHMRTHGHGLGSAISKTCRPKRVREYCPSCLKEESEDICHSIFVCESPVMRGITLRRLKPYLDHMATKSPAWTKQYHNAKSNNERVTLLLQSANFLEGKKFGTGEVAYAAKMLGGWMAEIRSRHPRYRQLGVQVHKVVQLSYYGSDEFGKNNSRSIRRKDKARKIQDGKQHPEQEKNHNGARFNHYIPT